METIEDLEKQLNGLKEKIENLKKEKETDRSLSSENSSAFFCELVKLIAAKPKEFFDYLERLKKNNVDTTPILKVLLERYKEQCPDEYEELIKKSKI